MGMLPVPGLAPVADHGIPSIHSMGWPGFYLLRKIGLSFWREEDYSLAWIDRNRNCQGSRCGYILALLQCPDNHGSSS
jgi:hypothetical protein